MNKYTVYIWTRKILRYQMGKSEAVARQTMESPKEKGQTYWLTEHYTKTKIGK